MEQMEKEYFYSRENFHPLHLRTVQANLSGRGPFWRGSPEGQGWLESSKSQRQKVGWWWPGRRAGPMGLPSGYRVPGL